MAIIKALGAVVPSLASREVYYGGAKHLVNIMHLLVPGIDLVSTRRLALLAQLNA